jgi:hypothetical protein
MLHRPALLDLLTFNPKFNDQVIGYAGRRIAGAGIEYYANYHGDDYIFHYHMGTPDSGCSKVVIEAITHSVSPMRPLALNIRDD